MRDFSKDLKEIKGVSHIVSIPIKEFENITELDKFVKEMNKNGVGVTLHHEQSNFYQGVLVQTYDKETCTVKNYL